MKVHSLKNKGFSLIEIMVSLTIFSIVVVVAAGSLLSIVSANRKARSLEVVVNNLNFALESMTREMRVGGNYTCTDDCDNDTAVTFTSARGETIKYEFLNNAIQKYITEGGVTSVYPVISPEAVLTKVSFSLSGTAVLDTKQPKIFIIIQGYAGDKEKERTNFNIQTTVSQRGIDS